MAINSSSMMRARSNAAHLETEVAGKNTREDLRHLETERTDTVNRVATVEDS